MRRQAHLLYGGAGVVLLLLVTAALARLKPAARDVERGSVVVDAVTRGAMRREVRGGGVLTPETIRWVTAATDAHVERIVALPGTRVVAATPILELADEQQQQSARDAEWQLRAAQADYETLRAELENRRLDQEASAARLRSEYEQARLRAEADRELARQGLAARITQQLSQTTAEELARRLKIEEERVAVARASVDAQLASRRAAVEQRRALLALQEERRRALHVVAGIDGVLQQVLVQAGQRVTAGANLARVARTDRLKAEVRVADTQARDVQIGQRARVDTRGGVVDGHVARIDPAVTNGTVLVDVALDGALPAGARPDLAVDAVIELENLGDVVHVTRPVNARENAPLTVFRLSPDGGSARRVKVDAGRASATAIEVRAGLDPGDRVIVSDTTSFDAFDSIRLR